MSSASILMNMSVATPVAAAPAAMPTCAAGALPVGAPDFDQAMLAAQVAEPVSLELLSGLLAKSAGEDSGSIDALVPLDVETVVEADSADAAESGAAAVLAQILLGSSAAPPVDAQPPAEAPPQSIAAQASGTATEDVVARPKPGARAGRSREDAMVGTASGPADASVSTPVPEAPEQVGLVAPTPVLPDDLPQMTGSMASASQSAPQAGNAAQLAVQAAANALRDSSPVPASLAPVHAPLREPVGSARWADELGNRLVLMSVRGQQQGSLTLTPEHLGPVEVQISVNRDTANVWFGAQHADTRAALTDAMPRLREMLASSGLSLGQSGVSEQAPREGFASRPALAGHEAVTADADLMQPATPAWRIWRPGRIDTYA